MQRQTYGLNFQTANASRFYQITPLGYIETAPGDTIGGTVKTRLFSDTAKTAILNRAYYDVYAFYVPFRLLWDQWPEYISGEDLTDLPELPTVTDLFPLNFESTFTIGTTPSADRNTVWMRRAYNLIYNQFFKAPGIVDRDLDSTQILTTNVRPSTFHESARLTSDIPSIDITGATTVDDLRQDFSQDRFQKMRAYYGSKYTDFLAASGVQANWSIEDAPELIGQKHHDLSFITVPATAPDEPAGEATTNEVGDTAGYYDGVTTLRVKNTFCPEHGLVCAYAVAKIDTYNRSGSNHPMLSKGAREKYWSPEFEAQTDDVWPNTLLGNGNDPDNKFFTTQYEDYRKGANMYGLQTFIGEYGYTAGFNNPTAGVNDYRARNPTDFVEFFNDRIFPGAGDPAEFQVTNEWKLTRKSPIKRGRTAVY